jgi:hypothetical protein
MPATDRLFPLPRTNVRAADAAEDEEEEKTTPRRQTNAEKNKTVLSADHFSSKTLPNGQDPLTDRQTRAMAVRQFPVHDCLPQTFLPSFHSHFSLSLSPSLCPSPLVVLLRRELAFLLVHSNTNHMRLRPPPEVNLLWCALSARRLIMLLAHFNISVAQECNINV